MSRITDGLALSFQFWQDGLWHDIADEYVSEGGLRAELPEGTFEAEFRKGADGRTDYTLRLSAPLPSKLRMTLSPAEPVEGPFHLIPCCLHGDNNADVVRPGEFPLLTDKYPGVRFCAPEWEFRADRAAAPLSALCGGGMAWGASIDPYAKTADGAKLRNGVFARLPDSFGVTLGYTNRPVTFVNKQIDGQTVGDSARSASATGTIYRVPSRGREGVHAMVRAEYAKRRDLPRYEKNFREAADGLFDAFVGLNWSAERGEYTNRCCRPGDWLTMRPWRSVTEIGWTGGAVLALPMLMYERLTPGFAPERYRGAMTAAEQFDRICSRYNPASGMIFDLMTPNAEGSDVNGWWTGYGLVKDCHCAYNSGTAAYSLLYAADFLKSRGEECPPLWLETGRKVVEAACDLQREDGAFGYTYATDRRAVTDWEGFAGCWFAAAAALLHRLTGEARWRECAMRALRHYARDVRALNCWGTPMDTWKAVDQEGNLAFIRAASILYRDTRDGEALELLKLGAEYEYLWRFGYRTQPEHAPIDAGWSACGGSVTSVSNPHIHPMGALVNADLEALADATGDDYHRRRAEDGVAWLMQTLELYPGKTGYGRYGVLSERWCPSDGLLVERYNDGRMYSSWFSYNLWAAADALQCVCEQLAAGRE